MLFVGLWKADWTRVHWVACPHPIPQTHSQPLHSMNLRRNLGSIWMATHQCPYFWHPGFPRTSSQATFTTRDPLVSKPMVQGESFTSFNSHRTAGLQVSCCAYRICCQVVHWAAPWAAGLNALCPTPSFSWLTSYLQIHFKCHFFGQAFLDILNSFSPQVFSNLAPSTSHLWCYSQLWWHIYLFLCLLLSIFPTDEFRGIRAMSVSFIVLYSVPGT